MFQGVSDLSQLKEIDDAIHFGELNVGDKVKILNPHDEVVAKVITPRTQIEPEEAAAPAAATEVTAAAGAAGGAATVQTPAAEAEK